MIDPHEHTEIPHDLYCQQCGYNLRGLTSNRCPECGESVESLRSQVSQIPWVHRKSIGSFRAYWRTVWWVSFKYKRFCEEIARPVEYRDSQAFRWTTICYLLVPMLVVGGLVYAMSYREIMYVARDSVIHVIWPTFVALGIVIAFLAAITGIPSWFFDDRDLPVGQRNSAIAMSYYCCGALAWLAPGTLLTVIAAVAFSALDSLLATVGLVTVLLVSALCPLMSWWFSLIRTAKRSLPHKPHRATALAIGTPVLWLVAAILILGSWAVVFYGVLLLRSIT